MSERTTTLPPDADAVRRAIARAEETLLRSQQAAGSWSSRDDMGPATLALVAVALRFAEQLDPADAAEIDRELTAHQREDGSFVAYPFAETGEICATATGWAALRAVGVPGSDPRVERTRAFVEKNGGVAAVVDRMKQGDLGALALGMAGILDPKEIPSWTVAGRLAAVPLVERWMERRVNVGLVMMLLQIDVVVSHLRGASGAELLAADEHRRCLELLETFRNADGGWNGNALQTALALATLHALGLGSDDPRVSSAAAWLRRRLARGRETMTFDAFGSAVWSGALTLRALIHGGVPRSHPAVARAVSWLLSCQNRVPQPSVDNPGAVRVGGWSFQHHNETMPDPDDTGVVLGAIGLALAPSASGELPPDLAERARAAVQAGAAWALGMQNADGGFPAFEQGLAGKDRAAPMMAHAVLEHPGLLAALRVLVRPPPKLGDPSTADVTARLLYGLARSGHARGTPEVERMIAFLESQQLPSGAYWGRWMVNYLPATACVLMGLAAAGVDRGAPVVQRAVRWILDRQNADGGWGEGVFSYRDPSLAGVGPSMPPLTGLVVTALVDAGEGASEAVARAARYLVAEQRADGTWPNGDWLHVFVAPDYLPSSFYYLPLAAQFYPLEALGRYAEAQAGGTRAAGAAIPVDAAVPRGPGGAWNVAWLEAGRGTGDPLGDAVVQRIFAGGDVREIQHLLASVARSDDALPEGLPAEVSDFFEVTAVLPPWADPARIAVAQGLFTRHGWATAAALFCSSLPQAYAAARGARVLLASQRMSGRAQRRILKTAQFVFDVMDEGGLAASGRGIRSAQKVRLLHAGIRHFLLQPGGPGWDPALGVPINQEDLAGTMMTFSCVVLDAFTRLGLSYSADEAEAWLHVWKIVGHLLGVEDGLLPRDVRDGDALMDAIRNQQWEASDAGKELTRVLVATMQEYLLVPGLQGLPAALIRHLAGDRCGDLLGLPRADWTRTLIDAEAALAGRLGGGDRGSRLSALVDQASHALMKGVVDVQLLGQDVHFHVPLGLQSAWSARR